MASNQSETSARNRYIPSQLTAKESDWYFTCASDLAGWSAGVLSGAKTRVMRKGQAHQYLLAAHLQEFSEGAGDDAAIVYLRELLEAMERGR